MLLDMYKGVANSPETTITNNINETDTIVYVLDETKVPELPNLMVLGTGVSAETVKVLSIDGNAITVERGFQGIPKTWNAGTIIARNFTEYDYNALVENVKKVDTRVGPLASLLTTIKTSIVDAINSLKGEVNEHKAESASKHIHSSGSNANGRYIKFDDGTMICTKSVTITGDITDNTFNNTQTWASTFIDNNIAITITTRNPVTANFRDYLRQIFITPYTTTVTLRIVPITGQTMTLTNQQFDIAGIGRWK